MTKILQLSNVQIVPEASELKFDIRGVKEHEILQDLINRTMDSMTGRYPGAGSNCKLKARLTIDLEGVWIKSRSDVELDFKKADKNNLKAEAVMSYDWQTCATLKLEIDE